jgi:arylsulfatase A-like enzyme
MKRPNVLMFMIDTFRPDHLEPWGPPAKPTPGFKRLADEGVFFRNHFAHMPSSHPARASILTGRDPHTTGIRINNVPLPAAEVTLTQLLRDAGYATALTREDTLRLGLDRGFDETGLVEELFADGAKPWDIAPEIPECTEMEAGMDLPQDVAASIHWLKAHKADPTKKDQPFFLWADVEDVHGAWHAPEPFGSRYTDPDFDGPDMGRPPTHSCDMPPSHKAQAIALYDGMVALVDKYIQILLKALDDLDLVDDTLLLVMSDHAGSLGEHNMWGKMCTVYDPVLRSVLMMRYPGVVPAGVQTSGQTVMNDVFATVANIAGVEIPEQAERHCVDLAPLWQGKNEVRDVVPMEFNLYSDTVVKAVRTPKWKFIYNHSLGEKPWCKTTPTEIFRKEGWERVMLFDLENDPGETNNVIHQYPDIARDMHWKLTQWLIDSENDLSAPAPA